MQTRTAYIVRASANGRRQVCIDALNETAIMEFLNADPARLKKFRQIINIIIDDLRISELYDKEDINELCKDVTAMKMFKGGQNIRIYCKEQRTDDGIFCVIAAELLPKKKDNKVKGKTKSLIQKVASYNYVIAERP